MERYKKNILIIAACISLTTLVSCDINPKPKSSKVDNLPTIVIDTVAATAQYKKDTIDLGLIYEGETVTGTFQIANKSSKPAVILEIMTGCGCTTTRYDRSPIKPDQTRQVQFAFDTRGKYGHPLQSIDVVTDTYEHYSVMLRAQVKDRK